MKNVFVVYKTDAHHSYASRDIIGIATLDSYAIMICQQQAKKEGNKIEGHQLWNLQHLKQTQGYEGEGEFQFESVAVDRLL